MKQCDTPHQAVDCGCYPCRCDTNTNWNSHPPILFFTDNFNYKGFILIMDLFKKLISIMYSVAVPDCLSSSARNVIFNLYAKF